MTEVRVAAFGGGRPIAEFNSADIRYGRVYLVEKVGVITGAVAYNVYAEFNGNVLFIGGNTDREKAEGLATTFARGMNLLAYATPVTFPEAQVTSNGEIVGTVYMNEWRRE